MLLQIPNVLSKEEAASSLQELLAADWVDGKITAGAQSAKAKNNLQLPETHPLAQRLANLILDKLTHNGLFMSAALPQKIFPPLFNRYDTSHSFDYHIDNAVRQSALMQQRVRTDLSATLFLSEPDSYDGGELVIDDVYGTQQIKLPAGHMILYPASSLHRVMPVTRGERCASFFWVQSMVREDSQRAILFDMDVAIQQLNQVQGDHPALIRLTGAYHNLLRRWVDV